MANTTNRPQRANRSAAVDRDKDASEKTESTYLRLSWWNLSNGHMDCDEHDENEHESDDDSSNSNSHNSHTKDNDRSLATLDIDSERTKLLRLIAAETKHKNERHQLQRRRRAIRKATGRVVDDRDIDFADADAYDDAYANIYADADYVESTHDSGGHDAIPFTSTTTIEKQQCARGTIGSDSLSSSSHSHNHNRKGESPSKKKKRTNKRRSSSSSNSSTTTDAADADADVHTTTTTHADGHSPTHAGSPTTTTTTTSPRRRAKERSSDLTTLSQHSSHSNKSKSHGGALRKHTPKKTKKKKTKKKKQQKKQQTNACAHVGGLGRIDFTGQITMSPSSTNSKHKQGGDHHKKVYQYDSKQKNSPKRKPSTKVRSIDPKILPPSSFARAQNPFGSERTLNSFHSNSSLTSCQNSKSKSNSLHSSMKSCLKDSANDRDTTPGPRSSDVDISSSNSSSSSTCNGRPSATRFLIPTNDDIENAAANAAANANATKKKSKKRSKSKKKTKKSQSRSKLFQKLSDSQITVSPGEDEIHDTPPLKRRKWKKVVHNLLKKTHLQLPHHHEQQQQEQHPNKEHPNKQAVDIPDAEINDSGRTASTAAETVAASSTRSIRMEEEEPPPPIPKKCVQFNPMVRVKRTLSHYDMSPNEKYAYWSSGSDGYDEYITEQILARQTEEWIQKKEEDYKEDCLQRKLQLLHQQIQEAY